VYATFDDWVYYPPSAFMRRHIEWFQFWLICQLP
jgi:hypothetical protein